jgi:alpha-N-arabinofuranosidase
MTTIKIDANPRFSISPRLYMQFMEPLGTTDSSVEACWDVLKDGWREDVIEAVRDLAPSSIRWGGILTSFWKWRESVGDPAKRPPMVNYLWGGWEKNRVGVDEFLEFCEAVAAEPIMAINFAADGRPEYISTELGENRSGDAAEAADLVSYCNDPDHAERKANGRAAPWAIRTWQVGNETSYPAEGKRFTARENAEHYLDFAKAMRARDNAIQIIGWGDKEHKTGHWWAKDLIAHAGEEVDMVAIHMMHQRPRDDASILHGRRFRQDYGATWAALGEVYDTVESKLVEARQVIADTGSKARLAITEGHLSLQPHNKTELLREWISGLFHARTMILYERNADIVDIATLADFVGTTWTVNAMMLGSPREVPYLLPVGHVMRLFRRHSGEQGLSASSSSSSLEVSASRSGNTIYLHLVNTDLDSAASFDLDLDGAKPSAIRCRQIAADVSEGIDSTNLRCFDVIESEVAGPSGIAVPKGAVAVYEIELAP